MIAVTQGNLNCSSSANINKTKAVGNEHLTAGKPFLQRIVATFAISEYY